MDGEFFVKIHNHAFTFFSLFSSQEILEGSVVKELYCRSLSLFRGSHRSVQVISVHAVLQNRTMIECVKNLNKYIMHSKKIYCVAKAEHS